jgi:hypothetical protein
MSKKSNGIVEVKHRKALSDVFSTLLQIQQQKVAANSIVAGETKNRQQSEEVVDFLEVAVAESFILEPSHLSDAVQLVLEECKNLNKLMIKEMEFIEITMKLMLQGVLPPISFLLTPLESYAQRKKKHDLHLSSEELVLQNHVQPKPQLKAERMTNKLTEYRYKERKNGKLAIEDSLISCKLFFQSVAFLLLTLAVDIDVYENKIEQLKKEIEEETKANCTFQPLCVASFWKESLEKRQERKSRLKHQERRSYNR